MAYTSSALIGDAREGHDGGSCCPSRVRRSEEIRAARRETTATSLHPLRRSTAGVTVESSATLSPFPMHGLGVGRLPLTSLEVPLPSQNRSGVVASITNRLGPSLHQAAPRSQ